MIHTVFKVHRGVGKRHLGDGKTPRSSLKGAGRDRLRKRSDGVFRPFEGAPLHNVGRH